MADKEQFTFDDDDFPETVLGDRKGSQEGELSDDDFLETDLSSAFSEGEHSTEDLEQGGSVTKGSGSGGSRTRILLIILLLVVAGGAGIFYFMDLGETTAVVPTVAVPAMPASKSVDLPPKPIPEPAPPSPTESSAKPVTVVLPPPPIESAVQETAVMTAEEKVATEQPKIETDKPTETEPLVSAPIPKDTLQEKAAAESEPQANVQTDQVLATPTAKSAKAQMPAISPKQVEKGVYALDAGSYLLESNRDLLVKKIKKLGYEALVTPIDATLDMTRLRLGTFSKEEVQDALAFARTIEPGSYSAPAGDGYVIYAGTFLKSGNVAKLSQRFLEEGITVHPEPVQVVRTLSRIRFGSFATQEEAAVAAREVADAGVKAVVVKYK